MRNLFNVIVVLALSQTGAVAAAGPAQAVNPDAKLIADFKQSVDQYVAERNKADDSTPALKPTEDPAQIREAQNALAERLRTVRAAAKQGDIFSPAIASHFKKLLRPETSEKTTKEAIRDDNPGAIAFKINGSYPDKEALATVPPNVLAALPKLPENQDIEYRFVGKHLILLDARAHMIIDYIPNVLP